MAAGIASGHCELREVRPAVHLSRKSYLALGQNLVALVNIKIAGKWVFTPLTLIITDFDTHPFVEVHTMMMFIHIGSLGLHAHTIMISNDCHNVPDSPDMLVRSTRSPGNSCCSFCNL